MEQLQRFFELTLEKPQGVFVFLLAVAIALGFVLLTRRISLLTRGSDGKSLEGTIRTLQERVHKLESHATTTTTALNNLDARVMRSVQGVSVERFDPFQNAGGQQSFTSALLNEKGDGVVISGIHARDGVRVYAKEVTAYASARELSEEERKAIEEAKKKLST